MSAKAVNEFRGVVESNREIQIEISSVGRSAQSIVDVATRHGYAFSTSDLESVMRDTDLSEFELEIVSGAGDDEGQSDWSPPTLFGTEVRGAS